MILLIFVGVYVQDWLLFALDISFILIHIKTLIIYHIEILLLPNYVY
jgi:hypothetical protein